jgi:nucleolar protein 56
MEAILLPTVNGLLLVNKDTDEVLKVLFQQDSLEDLAQKYLSMQKGESLGELSEALQELQEKGIKSIRFENRAYLSLFQNIPGLHGQIYENIQHLRKLQENLIQLWMDAGISFTAQKVGERTKIFSEIMIKEQIAEVATQEDFQVKQAVDTMVDLDKSINFFSTRLREWYGLHFPELTDKLIADNIQFSRYVAQVGTRSNFTVENLQEKMHVDEKRAKLLEEKAKRSMGGKLSDQDVLSIQKLAHRILDLHEFHNSLEEYITSTLDHIAPNLTAVLGASITAKLISIAGSLERLANMSSSTIQVLGAEKALFKAMRAGGDTPKYGIIFQWSSIRGEKAHLRGKIARMAAGKISILAKVDYFKGKFIGTEYKALIEKKIEALRKQFPKPPKKDKKSRTSNQKGSSKRNQGGFRQGGPKKRYDDRRDGPRRDGYKKDGYKKDYHKKKDSYGKTKGKGGRSYHKKGKSSYSHSKSKGGVKRD